MTFVDSSNSFALECASLITCSLTKFEKQCSTPSQQHKQLKYVYIKYDATKFHSKPHLRWNSCQLCSIEAVALRAVSRCKLEEKSDGFLARVFVIFIFNHAGLVGIKWNFVFLLTALQNHTCKGRNKFAICKEIPA